MRGVEKRVRLERPKTLPLAPPFFPDRKVYLFVGKTKIICQYLLRKNLTCLNAW